MSQIILSQMLSKYLKCQSFKTGNNTFVDKLIFKSEAETLAFNFYDGGISKENWENIF